MVYDNRVSWMVEDRIILAVLEGDLAAAPIEFMRAYDAEINRLLDESSASLVHMIVDMSAVTKLPDYRLMSRNFTFPGHPRLGWTLTVGLQLNPMVRLISYLTTQVSRARTRQVDTVAAALHYLQQVDVDLPDLSALNS